MKDKTIWIDYRNIKSNGNHLSLIYNLSFNHILIEKQALKDINPPKKVNLVVAVNAKEDLKDLPKQIIVFSESAELLKHAHNKGYKTAYLSKIHNEETMNFAWKNGMNFDYLVVEIAAVTNIPLELLIAKLQHTNTILLKKVNSVQEAEIVGGVMEIGSDGILFHTDKAEELISMDQFNQKQQTGIVKLVKGKVIDVQHAGMGYRACIDTTSILKENEGMIIGSTSEGGLLVSSETHYLPYMELRPFRVNAGAVHSYIWCPNENTAYITELKGGSRVLCIDTKGITREVVVGRVKTELRPLLKIEVEANGKRINTFVQDDWHIRIFGSQGEPLNASEIKVNDELLTYICESGRHVGIKINENIEEK